MSNETEAVEAPVEPSVLDTSAPAQLVGGEVHIIADRKTGAIQVNAPANVVIALGLLEIAKVILIQRQQDAMKAAETPRIHRATAADIPKLVRPS